MNTSERRLRKMIGEVIVTCDDILVENNRHVIEKFNTVFVLDVSDLPDMRIKRGFGEVSHNVLMTASLLIGTLSSANSIGNAIAAEIGLGSTVLFIASFVSLIVCGLGTILCLWSMFQLAVSPTYRNTCTYVGPMCAKSSMWYADSVPRLIGSNEYAAKVKILCPDGKPRWIWAVMLSNSKDAKWSTFLTLDEFADFLMKNKV